MFGYLNYQQQIVNEIYAKISHSPTPAELFVQRLGRTSNFNRLNKKDALTGEFGFNGDDGYLAVIPADFINECGRDYVVLLKTIWIPKEKRHSGIFRSMLSEFMAVLLNQSPCSVITYSRPFEFPDTFNPIVDPIPPHLKLDYNSNPQSAKIINDALDELKFEAIDTEALVKTQRWEDELESNNPASQGFFYKNPKSTWMLDSFFNAIQILR